MGTFLRFQERVPVRSSASGTRYFAIFLCEKKISGTRSCAIHRKKCDILRSRSAILCDPWKCFFLKTWHGHVPQISGTRSCAILSFRNALLCDIFVRSRKNNFRNAFLRSTEIRNAFRNAERFFRSCPSLSEPM